MMKENDISRLVVDAAYTVHSRLGPGLLESVYETVFAYEMEKRGLKIVRQVPVPVYYDQIKIDEGFRVDLIVENLVVVELKSVESVLPVHKKQLLTYLRLLNMKLGLLINFNESLIKRGITRIVNELDSNDSDVNTSL
jgi:GxxExxY protein